MPGLNSSDTAPHAARDLVVSLDNPVPVSPFSVFDEKGAALKQLVEFFDSATGKNTTVAEATPANAESPMRVAKTILSADRISPRVETKTPPWVVRMEEPGALLRVEAVVRHNTTCTSCIVTSNVTQRPGMEVEVERYPFLSRGLVCAVLESVQEESYLQQPARVIMTMSMAMVITVTDPESGAELEYRDFMKHPKMKDMWVKARATTLG